MVVPDIRGRIWGVRYRALLTGESRPTKKGNNGRRGKRGTIYAKPLNNAQAAGKQGKAQGQNPSAS